MTISVRVRCLSVLITYWKQINIHVKIKSSEFVCLSVHLPATLFIFRSQTWDCVGAGYALLKMTHWFPGNRQKKTVYLRFLCASSSAVTKAFAALAQPVSL